MPSAPTSAAGNWSEIDVAGHICEVYQPPRASEHGYTVIYLHGVHLNHLHDKPDFLREFDRHGFRVICPRTRAAGGRIGFAASSTSRSRPSATSEIT